MGYWDDFDKADKEESSGSGGIVGQLLVEAGFKVYVGGAGNAESWFPTAELGKAARLDAKRKAEVYAQEQGAQNQPKWSVQIRVVKDGAFSGGSAATWADDRFFVTNTWTSGFKEVVKPSLITHGIVLPFSGWGRVGFKNDPYFEAKGEDGKTDEDQAGNPRFPLVAYITELFASKEEAMVAVASGGSAEASEPEFVPEGWDATDWAECVSEIVEQKEMNAYSLAQVKKYVKDTYDVDLAMAEVVKVVK